MHDDDDDYANDDSKDDDYIDDCFCDVDKDVKDIDKIYLSPSSSKYYVPGFYSNWSTTFSQKKSTDGRR